MSGMVSSNANRFNSSPWRTVMGVLLVMFVFRSMIPAGFMPGASPAQTGHFGLILCSGINTPAASHDSHPDQQATSHCPFDLIASKAFLIPQLSLNPAPGHIYTELTPVTEFAWHAVVRRSPLGARAPPAPLG